MIYIVIYLYLLNSLHLYTDIMDDEEIMSDLGWVPSVFLWPILVPIHIVQCFLAK